MPRVTTDVVAAEEVAYPAQWEADVVLTDGRPCHLRPIVPADGPLLRQFHSRLSSETIYYRYFAPYPELSEKDVTRFTTVDHDQRVALVATVAGQIVGVGRYDRIDELDAEVAFTIRDDHQGRGLGSILLEHLAAAARERGIRRFVAEVLPSNRRMIGTFTEAGYKVAQEFEDGVIRLMFEIESTAQLLAVMQAREQRSEARSIERLLHPRSVAIVGASRRSGTIGHELLQHLIRGPFTGPVYAVHPEADEIAGVPAVRRVSDAPGPVDLAIVAVPADAVLAVVDDCAAARVSGLVVVSGGFSESGPQGVERQAALVAAARGSGMRVVGPNALGLINTDPGVALNASLSPIVPGRGRIGFFCQSGALGSAILERVVRRGLGLSTFMSAGNRADVSGNDMLQYWRDDNTTSLVLLYLESLGNPRKFTRIARRLSRHKPIVAVRSGRSSQAYPLGHAVRRTTLRPRAVDAMFAQAGVIQTESLDELFDVAGLLAFQPLPHGHKVAIIGNSDALGVLAADALEGSGLRPCGQPRTLHGEVDARALGQALAAVLDDPVADAVMVVHVPPVRTDDTAIRQVIMATAARATKPVVAVLVAGEDDGGLLPVRGPDGVAGHGSVPVFGTVEQAAQALGHVVRYARWRDSARGEVPLLDGVDADNARTLIESALAASVAAGGPMERRQGDRRGSSADRDGAAATGDTPGTARAAASHPLGFERRDRDRDRRSGQPLGPPLEMSRAVLTQVLAAFGVDLWAQTAVASEDEAVAAADALGWPVVLKTTVSRLVHRVELGGVRLNLENERALRTSFLSMAAQLDDDAAAHLTVQRMAPPGVACVVRTVEDPLFGPVVSFGIGGVVTELLEDRAYRIPPLTDVDAHELVREPGAAPLLLGHRGTDPVDVPGLENILLRVSRLADEVPELARLELNPVVAHPRGVAVLAARGWLREADPRNDSEARRLRN